MPKLYKERLVRYNSNVDKLTFQSSNRLVQFNLEPQSGALDTKKRKMKRSKSMNDGILKKTPEKHNKDPQQDVVTKKINQLLIDKQVNDQDCNNFQYNNFAKAQFQRQKSRLTTHKFIDQDYRPNHRFRLKNPLKSMSEGIVSNIQWKRISEIFPSSAFNLILYSTQKPKSFNFISKGSELCPDYLVQSFNCLRFNKIVLNKIFNDQKYSEDGIYHVTLFVENKWKTIIIDDYIPVFKKQAKKKDSNKHTILAYKPAFTYLSPYSRKKGQQLEIWHYLIEKAYSKHYSGYENILDNNIVDFIWSITGQSVESCFSLNADIDWYNIPIGSFLLGLTATLTKIPITMYPGKQRASFLVQGKQPIKQTIWPQDIPSFFPYVYIWGHKSYPYWIFSHLQEYPQKVIVRTLEINCPTSCCLNLTQQNKKISSSKHKKYDWLRIIILEKELENNFRWSQGVFSNSKTMKLEFNLGIGKYLILVIPDYVPLSSKKPAMNISLVLKSSQPVKLNKQKYPQNCFQKGCADIAQRFGRLNQLNKSLCSYNCIHEQMGMIIENINNQRVVGPVKVRRSISGLKPNLSKSQDDQQSDKITIEAFNKQFQGGDTLETNIPGGQEYTVVLLMKGGLDRKFFQGFNFQTKSQINQTL